MKIINIGIFYSFIALVYGCNVTTDEEVVMFDIDNDFEAQLRESLTTSGSMLMLELISQDAVPCVEAKLDYQIVDQGILEIELFGFSRPTVCNTTIVLPVITRLPIERSASGMHDVHLALRNSFVNEGTIEIKSDRYLLHLEVEKGFKVQSRTLMKTRSNMIWGYVQAEENVDLELLDRLESEVAPYVDEAPFTIGTYSDFFIGDNGDMLLREIEPPGEYVTFAYQAVDVDRALSAMISFKDNLPDDVSMTIFTGQGQTF